MQYVFSVFRIFWYMFTTFWYMWCILSIKIAQWITFCRWLYWGPSWKQRWEVCSIAGQGVLDNRRRTARVALIILRLVARMPHRSRKESATSCNRTSPKSHLDCDWKLDWCWDFKHGHLKLATFHVWTWAISPDLWGKPSENSWKLLPKSTSEIGP